jgi:hypothetical protein
MAGKTGPLLQEPRHGETLKPEFLATYFDGRFFAHALKNRSVDTYPATKATHEKMGASAWETTEKTKIEKSSE